MIPPVSEKAHQIFNQSFPKILALVNEKQLIETKYLTCTIPSEQCDLVGNAHRNFGNLLRAVYEFHLYQHLVEEFCWYLSIFTHRGFEKSYLENMIKTWNFAIQSVIKPPESHELVCPLEWLLTHLPALYAQTLAEVAELPFNHPDFLHLLLNKKRKEAAEYALFLLANGVPIDRLYTELLATALHIIGERWQKNTISVVDVHVATDICRYIMMRLADSTPVEEKLPYQALVTCAPGEEHEIGPEILENFLEIKGWQVYSMGHIAPENDIIATMINSTPHVVFVSVTLLAHLPSAKVLVQRMRSVAPRVKIVLGGRAALCARPALKDLSDAIVEDIAQGHFQALLLVNSHA